MSWVHALKLLWSSVDEVRGALVSFPLSPQPPPPQQQQPWKSGFFSMYITNLHPPLRNPTAALEGYKLLPGCKPSLDVRTLATVLDLATCLVGGWKRGSRDAEVTARAYLVEDKNQGFRLEMAFWRHWRVSRARPCFHRLLVDHVHHFHRPSPHISSNCYRRLCLRRKKKYPFFFPLFQIVRFLLWKRPASLGSHKANFSTLFDFVRLLIRVSRCFTEFRRFVRAWGTILVLGMMRSLSYIVHSQLWESVNVLNSF